MKKPIIGILATPYVNEKIKKKQVFLTNFFVKFFKHNNIDFIVIPYNLSKIKLKTLIKNVDGLLFPGSQIGNYYYAKEFKEHYKKQKFILKFAKLFNKTERILPILSICHGFQNSMLIESKESIDDLFTNVHAYFNYKKDPIFINSGEKLRKLYNKSRKLIHNNKLGISPKKINKTKKIYLLAKTEDKNGKEFIEIIKHKNYPFYGFQGHVERSNPELLIPYVIDIKRSFNKRCIKLNKSCKLKKIVYGKTVKCKDYGLAKKNNNRKCFIYNI
jgi:gamma-glutamyl-gamma-aminobutyrate hydrolase PuuD